MIENQNVKKYTFYSIVETATNEPIYVGKTCNFKSRCYAHIYNIVHGNKIPVYKYISERGQIDNGFVFNVIEERECTLDESKTIEIKYIKNLKPICNVYKPFDVPVNLMCHGLKRWMREYFKMYRKTDKNREYQKNYQKAYRESNSKQMSEISKRYYLKNKEKFKEYRKKYESENKEKRKEYAKLYYLENKDKFAEYRKKYESKNKEKRKEYRLNNMEKISDYMKNYMKNYNLEHREKKLDYMKKYYAENKDQYATYYLIRKLMNNQEIN